MALSVNRMAVWPNVEYSSAPGEQVSSEMRNRQLSWATETESSEKRKKRNRRIFFKAKPMFAER
jgi:hypothetical protein